MAEVNTSWVYSMVPQPNGAARTKVEAFVIAHGDGRLNNHSVIATATLEFPNPEVARIILDALAQAIGGMKTIVPAQTLPPDLRERN